MDELARLRERVEELERDNARLRDPTRSLWSKRDLVWNQLERALRVGTWTWDVATQKVSWSPNLFEILGYDPAVTPVAEAARVFDEAVHPDDLEAYLAGQERALRGDTSQPTRFRFIRPDGRTIHVLLLYTAVKDERGEASSFAGSILDVTERVEAESDLLRAGRLEAVGYLAGSVAHDFNNLLMIVQGNADLLLLDHRDCEELRQISAAVEAGSSLTHQLLSFTNQGPSEPGIVALDELVEATVPLLERLIREDVRILLDLGCRDGFVAVDSGRFQTALVNLAINARDAMPEGGELLLRTRSDHFPTADGREDPREAVVVCVEDSGCGMDEATQARIFEPFFTTKDGTRGPTGTGLGLTSVQSFARASGCEVRVRSRVGAGTSFELFFPRVERLAVTDAGARGEPSAVSLAHGEVLVVDDSPGIRRVVTVSLKRAGLVPHTFTSAEEALEAWPRLRDRVRVLITDVVMPGRSGRELATVLRRDCPELGVVFVTGYDPTGERLERSVVLGKPFTLAQLLDAMRAVSRPIPIEQPER